jgi:hypothetical protein
MAWLRVTAVSERKGQQVAVVKTILAEDNLARCVRYRSLEGRSVIDKGVEFSVLSAGIDGKGQHREELLVKIPAHACAFE